ncbi:MAG: membrane protein insertase YidC [Microscillaceae bacterium]|nr:membrane protein insertase YidC [Microscillaceae bacterium]MDW8460526.1 membrane protein insertase YidC [Cytophagales bacterium]
MDRNQLTGLLLIFIMLLIYFEFLAPKPQPQNPTQNKPTEKQINPPQKTFLQEATQLPDSIRQQKYGNFASVLTGEKKSAVLENDYVKIRFSSQGATIQQVELKKYKTSDKKPLFLLDEKNHSFELKLNTTLKELPQIDLYSFFYTIQQEKNTLRFVAKLTDNQSIEHIYTLAKEGYTLDYSLKLNNLENLLNTAKNAQFIWKQDLKPFEYDIRQSRYTATINFYDKDGSFDYLSETNFDPQEKLVEKNLHWFSFKQRFFNSALIAPNHNLHNVYFRQITNESNPNIEKSTEAQCQIPFKDLQQGKGKFQFYFGPNHYYTLSAVTDGFHKNVYTGLPIVNWVSRYLVIPVFAFFEQYTSNYGIVILLLMIVTRIIIFPLAFRSYISMAKMKVLKPELDEIRERTGGDMQKMQIEQMELYRQVGVNPLSGCIPLLLQLPVLFALFTFLPNAIELRQKSFLWANDLSTYDSILRLPFYIPFYGDHVSLFTILMTASTLLLTYINSQTQANMDSTMKFMMYFMPVMLMFVLNTLPAGLNYYYFISNIASIAQQYAMKFFVDEAQIRKKLEENKIKNKDKKKSAFQRRLEEAMKQAQEQKQLAQKRKQQEGKK